MDQRLDQIKRKIVAARRSLGPVLSEREVTAFEGRHSVRLPEGYRRFLLEVGNGGDGPPEYGIARLGEAASDMTEDERRDWSELDRLDQEFPFTAAWIWEDEPGMWDDEARDWSKAGKTKLARTKCGNLYIGNDGCGQYWHLIVTGPEGGNIWLFTGVGITPTDPNRDFLRWYEDWLDGVRNWWA